MQHNGSRFRQFFATVPVPCPYLPMRAEQKLVIELRSGSNTELHTELSRAGFRRSHHLAYRPACRGCQACVPVRINSANFAMTRSFRRIWRTHEHLVSSFETPRPDGEHFALFRRYVRARHPESEMALMAADDFASMLLDTPVETAVLTLRDSTGQLVAACLCDHLTDGISAVYSYFEPEAKGSLGSHIVMRLVEAVRRKKRPYVYLGYWIDGSETMAYKNRFPGVEALKGGQWRPLASPPIPQGAGS